MICQVHDCPTEPIITWATVNDRPLGASISANRTHSTLTFDPVKIEDEGQLTCKARCGDRPAESRASVGVYCEFPTRGEFGPAGLLFLTPSPSSGSSVPLGP